MIVALTVSATIVSCRDKIETVSGVDLSKIPSEEIKGMQILYTENGVIKYDFVADKVDHYQYNDTSYYVLPAGFYGRSFILIDSTAGLSVANADVKGDEGLYKQNPEFFEAYHNVVARNLLINQRLETDTLYYDPAKEDKAIYSYSRSVVIRPPDTIPALSGFSTDKQFKMYELVKARKGTVYFDMTPDSTATPVNPVGELPNSQVTDSTNNPSDSRSKFEVAPE